MKTLRLILLALIIILLLAIEKCTAYSLEIEIIATGTLHADHFQDECVPHCANEDNGGDGFQLTFDFEKGTFGLFWVWFINSHGDPGWLFGVQPTKAEYANKYFRINIAPWFMQIHGYKNADGDPIVVDADMIPKFTFGINPAFIWADDFYINYNFLYMPGYMKIDWYSLVYNIRF